MAPEHFDVLIMGAGLSGIDAAYHLQKLCPSKSYVILEQRERIGGTWDLFRYPGIRSDSDMLTMGYSFRPWTHPKAISPGDDIRDYLGRAEAGLALIAAMAPPNGGGGDEAAFVEMVRQDAARARTAMRFVLGQRAIGSQMIDNLNASIHLRTLLTDLFLLDEALKISGG